jgi:DeoR/GlpR family transcriptional regulator of sugar metabolism
VEREMLTYRHNKILEFVRKNGFCSADELAKLLNTSAMTIRRDFTALEKERLIARVHGGAVPVDNLLVSTHIAIRLNRNIEEKKKIAACAASLIERDDSVFIDAGSTCCCLAEMFPEDRSVTVITHSLNIVNILKSKVGVKIICTGGSFEEDIGAFTGSAAEACLNSFYVNKSFVGAAGISLEMGCASNDVSESRIKAIMYTHAKEGLVLADATKFSSPAFHSFLPIEQTKKIITDSALPRSVIKQYKGAGVDIIVA